MMRIIRVMDIWVALVEVVVDRYRDIDINVVAVDIIISRDVEEKDMINTVVKDDDIVVI